MQMLWASVRTVTFTQLRARGSFETRITTLTEIINYVIATYVLIEVFTKHVRRKQNSMRLLFSLTVQEKVSFFVSPRTETDID